MEMGVQGCARAHTDMHGRVNARLVTALAFSAGKRKVTRGRVKSASTRVSRTPDFRLGYRDGKSRSDAPDRRFYMLPLFPWNVHDKRHDVLSGLLRLQTSRYLLITEMANVIQS